MASADDRMMFLQQFLTALFQPPASQMPQANDPASYERSRRSQAEAIANHYLDTVHLEATVEEALAPVPTHLPLLRLHALTPRQATDHNVRKGLYIAHKTRQFRIELPKYDDDIVGRKEALIKFGDDCLTSFFGPDWANPSEDSAAKATPSRIYSNAPAYPPVSSSFGPPHTCPHGVPIAPSGPAPAMPPASKNPSAPTHAAKAEVTPVKEAAEASQHLAHDLTDFDTDDESDYDSELEEELMHEFMQDRGYWDYDDLGYGSDDPYGLDYYDDPYGLEDDLYGDDLDYDPTSDPNFLEYYSMGYNFDEALDATINARAERLLGPHLRREMMMNAALKKGGKASKTKTRGGASTKASTSKMGTTKGQGKGSAGTSQQRTPGAVDSGVGSSKASSAKDGSATAKKKGKRKRKGKGKAKAQGQESGVKVEESRVASKIEGVKANHTAVPASVVKASGGSGPATVVSQAPASSSDKDPAGLQVQPARPQTISLAHKLSSETVQGSPRASVASVGLGLAGSPASVKQPVWHPVPHIKVSLPAATSGNTTTSPAPEASTSTSSAPNGAPTAPKGPRASTLIPTAREGEASLTSSATAPKAAGQTKRKRTDTSNNSVSSADKAKASAKVAKSTSAQNTDKPKKQPKFEVFVWKKRYRPSKRPYRDCWHAPFRA